MRTGLSWCIVLACMAGCADDRPPRLLLGSTHTLEDSGILDALTRAWQRDHDGRHRLSVVVAGSGEIIAMARRGDLDVLLVHSPRDEKALVASGRAVSRQPVMHNEFVLLGPGADPASVATAATAADALRRIADASAPFVSRGDSSGTHRKEQELWALARTTPAWGGYLEAGTGMAEALRLASERHAYILSDRATFEVLREDLRLVVLHEGDEVLRNPYSVLVVADARNPDGARDFAAWLRGAEVQRLIGAYRNGGTGRALFVPDTTATIGSP